MKYSKKKKSYLNEMYLRYYSNIKCEWIAKVNQHFALIYPTRNDLSGSIITGILF
jgi:hypothetical protein